MTKPNSIVAMPPPLTPYRTTDGNMLLALIPGFTRKLCVHLAVMPYLGTFRIFIFFYFAKRIVGMARLSVPICDLAHVWELINMAYSLSCICVPVLLSCGEDSAWFEDICLLKWQGWLQGLPGQQHPIPQTFKVQTTG